MLSRRQLRIKVLQALYAFFQSEKADLKIAEKELFKSIEKVQELYFFILLFLTELSHADKLDEEDIQHKYFPTETELKGKHRLHRLSFIKELEDNADFNAKVKNAKLSWQTEQDLIRKIFLELKKSKHYQDFIVDDKANERDFLIQTIKQFMESSEAFCGVVTERSIYWNDDISFCSHMAGRLIKHYYETKKLDFPALYKDERDDTDFVKTLFEKTIFNNSEYEQAIAAKTKNWEVERIAMMDILLMKMALAEMTTFKEIPVKVSINEYIDISKEYSTPKSKSFINGIIDKLSADYKAEGKIVKTGRGLME